MTHRHALLVLTLAACGPRMPSVSLPSDGSLKLDRDGLPDIELRILHTATIAMTERQVVAGGDKTPNRGPVSVGVLHHPLHGPVLIDAGYGTSTAAEPPTYPTSKFVRKTLDIEMVKTIPDALPDIELSVDDIRDVYVTHLHNDHAGGLEDLPNATLHTVGEEWGAAQKQGALSGYDPVPYAGYEGRVAMLDFDDGPVGPIPRTADVFGDGSLIALPAPGHTVGHVMYLVNGRERSWLFAGDAAWVDANWSDGPRPKGWMARTLVEVDWKQGVASLAALQWFHDQGVEVISGHEPANLERYRWPEPL